MKCEKCGKDTYKRFCSRSCANTRIFTQETKQKISKSIIQYCKNNGNKIHESKCVICNENTYKSKRTKYCNKCKPKRIVDGKVKCPKCNLLKTENEFYRRNKNNPTLTIYCKNCFNIISKEYQQKCKLKAVEYKGSKCSKCGYDKCVRALDFHHLNPEIKDSNLPRIYSLNTKKMKEELDKCILLCSNCHREEHWMLDNKGS